MSKRLAILGFACCLVAIGIQSVMAGPVRMSAQEMAARTRVCIPKSGHSTQLTISATDADTSELTPMTIYAIICDTAVYWEMGDNAAVSGGADSNSNYLPADVEIFFGTGDRVSNYLSAEQVSAGGTCFIRECL